MIVRPRFAEFSDVACGGAAGEDEDRVSGPDSGGEGVEAGEDVGEEGEVFAWLFSDGVGALEEGEVPV